MSQQAEAWYRELYLSKVTHKYKNAGFLLKPWITAPSRMDGKTLYFPVANGGTATKTKRGDPLKPMNTGRSLVSCTAEWWEAPEEIFDIDVHKMAPSEMESATKAASDALGQAHDGIVIAAIDAGTGTYGAVIGAYNQTWDLSKALKAETALFRKNQNPKAMAVCVLPLTGFNQMMTFDAFNNSQYVGDYPLVKGVQARTWGRTHYISGYDELFPVGGAANERRFYYWLPDGIGSGDTGGIKTNVFYDGRKRCWVHDNHLEAGAKVLLTSAFQECKMDIESDVAFA